MKLTFGDLDAKNRAIQVGKDKQQFERKVASCMEVLRHYRNLPDGDAPMACFPAAVRHYRLDVLRESARRLQTLRAS